MRRKWLALVTLRVQLLLALDTIDVSEDEVQAVIDAIEDDAERKRVSIYWHNSMTFNRGHPLIEQFAEAFELDSDDVDKLWQAAAAIE